MIGHEGVLDGQSVRGGLTANSVRNKVADYFLTDAGADPGRRLKQSLIIYTGCNRRNVRDFGRVFLRSNYTDITQNTYIQS